VSKTAKEVVEGQTPQVLNLHKQIRELEKERRGLVERLGAQQDFADLCAAAVVAMDPFPVPPSRKSSKVAKPISAVLDLSDWHVGEFVNSREVEGFNRYNWGIAQNRAFSIVTDFLNYVDVQRSVYTIDECVVCALGDYVSGDIHPELVATNEFPLPEQSVKAGVLLGECVLRVAGHFKVVRVEAVGADNHGRLQKKPQAKQKTANNMSFVVHAVAQASTERCPNVRWNVAKGAKLLVDVNGVRFLCEHGDAVRGQMGIPYYGFARMVGREATRRMNTAKAFDFVNMGHWHVPAFIEGRTLVNGSLSGTTEFDHIAGRHAPPSQVAFFVHPKFGIFNLTAFKC